MSANPYALPLIVGPNGYQPTPPSDLNSQMAQIATSLSPGITTDLPGSMVADLLGTGTAGAVLSDQARVELLNSLSASGANVFLLQQIGTALGVRYGQPTNASVYVVFYAPLNIGHVITNGFQIQDTSGNVYAVQGGGAILSTGYSAPLYAVAVNSGAFSSAEDTVTGIVTSVPLSISLSVTNPNAGAIGNPNGENFYSYRQRVIQAQIAACCGGPRLLKTLLNNVLGASNLTSVQVVPGTGIKVVVGGSADPYAIAYAIFQGIGDISQLTGSTINTGRNIYTGIYDYPDSYSIISVQAPTQTIALDVTWNTSLSGFAQAGAIPGLVQGVMASYFNTLAPGQGINTFDLATIFQNAVEPILDVSLLTRLVISVYINSTLTPPTTGTYLVPSDAESLCSCSPSQVTVVQG
jgi:hypothetical protein